MFIAHKSQPYLYCSKGDKEQEKKCLELGVQRGGWVQVKLTKNVI